MECQTKKESLIKEKVKLGEIYWAPEPFNLYCYISFVWDTGFNIRGLYYNGSVFIGEGGLLGNHLIKRTPSNEIINRVKDYFKSELKNNSMNNLQYLEASYNLQNQINEWEDK